MNLSNAPAPKLLQCAILRSNYGRAVSLFQPRVWFFGTSPSLLFLILSYRRSQMYAPSVLNRLVEALGGNDAFHSEHVTQNDALRPLWQLLLKFAKICRRLRC